MDAASALLKVLASTAPGLGPTALTAFRTVPPPAHGGPKPTARQPVCLKDLAAQRGQSLVYSATAADASREIARPQALRRTSRAEVTPERR